MARANSADWCDRNKYQLQLAQQAVGERQVHLPSTVPPAPACGPRGVLYPPPVTQTRPAPGTPTLPKSASCTVRVPRPAFVLDCQVAADKVFAVAQAACCSYAIALASAASPIDADLLLRRAPRGRQLGRPEEGSPEYLADAAYSRVNISKAPCQLGRCTVSASLLCSCSAALPYERGACEPDQKEHSEKNLPTDARLYALLPDSKHAVQCWQW